MKKIILLFLAAVSVAQTPVPVILPPAPVFDSITVNGTANAFGCVFTYISGTTTPLTTYSDSTGLVQNSNPVILNAAGVANIWIQSGLSYNFTVKTSGGTNCLTGTTVYTVNGIAGSTSQVVTNVTFSGTPTFTGTAQYQLFKMTLTGSVTSSTLVMSAVTVPSIVSFELTQDGIGGRTFVWPLNMSGTPSINLAANSTTTASFLWDGTTAFLWSNAQSLSTTIPFSATPTFAALSQNQLFKLFLTGNVTSSTLNMSAVAAPSILTFEFTQDATGGRTFVWPTNVAVINPGISLIPNNVTVQQFLWDGTNALAISPAISAFLSPTSSVAVSVPTVIFKNTTATTHTGDTTTDTVYSATLPVLGPTSTVRVIVGIQSTVQGAGTTTASVFIGATNLAQINITSTGSCLITDTISNQNSVSVQSSSVLGGCATTLTISTNPGAVNTGTAQTLAVKATNANNTDSQTFNQVVVELL